MSMLPATQLNHRPVAPGYAPAGYPPYRYTTGYGRLWCATGLGPPAWLWSPLQLPRRTRPAAATASYGPPLAMALGRGQSEGIRIIPLR